MQTNVLPNATILPESPAYNDEASPFTGPREILTAPGFKFQGDPNKFAETIHLCRLSNVLAWRGTGTTWVDRNTW